MGRFFAVEALLVLAKGQAYRRVMAKGGVMGALVEFYADIVGRGCDTAMLQSVTQLLNLLMRWEVAALKDLSRAILAPDTNVSLAALLLLKDSLVDTGGDIVPALDEAGVIDTLIATLKHDTPHCVALAAGALYVIAGTSRVPTGGYGLVEASDVVPALVNVIRRGIPPGDPADDKGLYLRDGAFDVRWRDETSAVHFSNPTAFVTLALGEICILRSDSRPTLKSFVDSGGVYGFVRLLQNTTCPMTFRVTVDTINIMVRSAADSVALDSERPTWFRDLKLADKFYEAGLCRAALHVLKNGAKSKHGEMLQIIYHFIATICPPIRSQETFSSAMEVLVEGGYVELAMAHLTETGPDLLLFRVGIFKQLLKDPKAKERMCAPKTVDHIMQWFSTRLAEGDGTDLVWINDVLSPVLDMDPCFIPAATKANVTPDLVRTLCVLCEHPDIAAAVPVELNKALGLPLNCLNHLLHYDMEHGGALWRHAIDSGLLPVLTDLLPRVNSTTTGQIIMVAYRAMLRATTDKLGRSGAGLVRAIARLVTPGAPVMTQGGAVKMLLDIGTAHPELMADCHTWGIEDTVRRLTLHSNPGVAYTAEQLQKLLFCVTQGSHKQKRKTKTPGSSQPTRPKPNAAGTPKPTATGSGGRHTTGAAPSTTPRQGGPSGPQTPEPPAEKASAAGVRCGSHGKGIVRACAMCGVAADMLENGGRLKDCSACRSVQYCGTVCQKAHWKAHKAACKILQSA